MQTSEFVAHSEAVSYLNWVTEEDSLIYMVLNKSDLIKDASKRLREAERRSRANFFRAGIDRHTYDLRVRFFAVSAKTGLGVEDVFRDIARELRDEATPAKSDIIEMDIEKEDIPEVIVID